MSSVSMKTTIAASADAVWEVISDFNGIGKFVAAVAGSTMEGSGVGAVRTLTFQDGGQVVERLEGLDAQARTLSYSILSAPLPLADYVSTMTVRGLGGGRCELAWSSTFEPKGAPEAEVRQIIEGVYSGGFEGLKALLGG